MHKKILAFVLILFLFLFACPYPDENSSTGEEPNSPFLTVVNGISENLTFINRRGYTPFVSSVLLGQSPNDILKYGAEVYVINSLSNSVIVFNYSDFSFVREFSVGVGQNPYKAVIANNKLYITAYETHKLLIYSLDGTKLGQKSFDILGSYKPYPQGIASWGNYIFIACMYSTDGGATNVRNPGRVALYDLSTDAVTGYIESGAANTNSFYLDKSKDILYTVSSGTYSSGFNEDGMIESIKLTDPSTDLSNPAGISLNTVASGSSFGVVCIYNDNAWIGNIGNGKIRSYDITGDLWTESNQREFQGSLGLAYIADIKFDPVDSKLYVTEFNGNFLYILEPGTLGTINSYKVSSSPTGADAQFMLMCW